MAIWAVSLLTAGGLVAWVVISAVGLVEYATADDPTYLDNPVVNDTAAMACRDLRTFVLDHPIPAGGSPRQQAHVIREQDQAITTLITTVRSLGAKQLEVDKPAVAWLADWRDLHDLRETYADEIAAGQRPDVTLPRVDGIPVTRRMTWAVTCPVARTIGRLLTRSPGSTPPVVTVPARWNDGRAPDPRRRAGARTG